MQTLPYRRCWGLFPKNIEVQNPIPLKSLNIDVNIIHNIARVSYTQEYYNDLPILVESEFYFPMSSEACFDSFEARFNDTTIKGVIKEKQEAQKQYQKEFEKGSIVAYSEINEEMGDIMKVLIGNIPPQSYLSITFSYIQKLEINSHKSWCFRLFSTFTPRYNGDLQSHLKRDIAILTNYPTLSPSNQNAYPWNVKINIQSPNPIVSLHSPSHEIVETYGNEKHTCTVLLDPKQTHYPNKDFVLMFNNAMNERVDCALTPFEDGYCAMITLLPESLDKEKVKKNTISLEDLKGEYIFLIDRSGSMKGERMEMAKNSLILFLKSLPFDSYFNIFSFGSKYEVFSHTSSCVKNSEEAITQAIAEVEEFEANLGGTEIRSPLKSAFEFPLRPDYPRYIFLLTDGAVNNTDEVLLLINKNKHQARLFTIGIGNGCSTELIIQGAANGRGKHEFVINNVDIYEKVIDLLDKSLRMRDLDLSFQAENFDAVVKSISPNPSMIQCVGKGEALTFFACIRNFAFEDGKKLTLKIRMYDEEAGDYLIQDVLLDPQNSMENDLIPKLAIHDMMKRLESNIKFFDDEKKLLWLDKSEIKSTLLEYSLEYEILCKATAFICEITENYGPNKSLTKTNVIVPTILSKDYLMDQPLLSKFISKPGKHGRAKVIYLPITQGEEGVSRSLEFEEALANRVPRKLAPFLPAVMKQSFKGYWNANDTELRSLVLKGKSSWPTPEEFKLKEEGENVWMTILVLLWLEIVCQEERTSWKLVHQKGCEWLQKKGINYEETKSLGESWIIEKEGLKKN